MFKSVFGHSHHQTEAAERKSAELDEHKQELNGLKKSDNPVKRGRKKLSSMMSRLHVGR